MNAEVRQIRTNAEQGLIDAFSAARGHLPGRAAVAALREDAFQLFESQGLPHRRVEEWKYTDLRALMRDAKPLSGMPDAAAKARARDTHLLPKVPSRVLFFVDGAFVPEMSDLAALESGLSIRSLAQSLAAADANAIQKLGATLPASDPVVALNTAFMRDGAVIEIADGAQISRPLQLAFVTSGESAASIYSRSLIVVGRQAQVTLVESHQGSSSADYQANHALEIVVGDESKFHHVKIGNESGKALHLGALGASIGARASFNTFAFALGGAVTRHQMFLRFAGEGATGKIGGASLLKGRQHVDNTLVIDHAAPRCTSRELFKAVLDGESRSIFQGKIVVQAGAQKTDAKMMTRALLLSEQAEADNKPELEIFADDVVCGHGATAGALDPELLFYLRSRGIPLKEAEALLIKSFIGEALDTIENEDVREALTQAADAWLAARG